MPTKPFNCRLTIEAYDRLRRLVAADSSGASQAEIISEALYEYEITRGPLAKRLLIEIYDRISEAIQTIESQRDLGSGLDAKAQEVLDFFNRTWDEARTLNLFTEPRIPPDPWEK